MADLVIGGNTYKSINAVKIRKADGSVGTFVDSSVTPFSPRGACLGIKLGLIGISKNCGIAADIQTRPLTALAVITLPTASQVGITRSFDAATIGLLPIPTAGLLNFTLGE